MEPLWIHTGPFAYAGADRVDVTRVTGTLPGLVLAPSWPLLRGYLEARAAHRADLTAWQRYLRAYLLELKASQAAQALAWDELVAPTRASATLVCRCPAGQRCHRYQAAIALAAWSEFRGRVAPQEGERE